MLPSPFFRPLSAASRLATRLTLTRRGQAALIACAIGAAIGPLPALVTGCGQGAAPSTVCPAGSESATPLIVSEAPACSCADPSPEASSSPAPSASAPAQKPACPEDMALVEGDYCPDVEQRCLEHGKEGKSAEESETICLKFEKPSVCLSASKARMRFCMDRYEFPNKEGELPRVLTTWEEAAHQCKLQNKRLCSESEFNFACEGEEMRPYSYGFERDASKCNQDKEYRDPPEEPLRKLEDCVRDKRCTAALAKLDQREPIGSHLQCVSPFGIYDLNGNVNEFVQLRYKQPPHRAALKGGWWGPVRARCRPIVMHHDEKYLGYEVGFRCCSKPLDVEEPAGKGARKGKGRGLGRPAR